MQLNERLLRRLISETLNQILSENISEIDPTVLQQYADLLKKDKGGERLERRLLNIKSMPVLIGRVNSQIRKNPGMKPADAFYELLKQNLRNLDNKTDKTVAASLYNHLSSGKLSYNDLYGWLSRESSGAQERPAQPRQDAREPEASPLPPPVPAEDRGSEASLSSKSSARDVLSWLDDLDIVEPRDAPVPEKSVKNLQDQTLASDADELRADIEKAAGRLIPSPAAQTPDPETSAPRAPISRPPAPRSLAPQPSAPRAPVPQPPPRSPVPGLTAPQAPASVPPPPKKKLSKKEFNEEMSKKINISVEEYNKIKKIIEKFKSFFNEYEKEILKSYALMEMRRIKNNRLLLSRILFR